MQPDQRFPKYSIFWAVGTWRHPHFDIKDIEESKTAEIQNQGGS